MTVTPRTALLAATLCAVLACASACKGKSGSSSPTQPTPTSRAVYAAIGASDAVGVGASVPCLPFVACPDGTGYVPLISRRLAQTREVSTTNLGVPAAVLSPEIQSLGQRYGRTIPANFIQGALPFVPRDATLVTVFAGGNDTNTIGTALEGGEGAGNPAGYIDQQVRDFGQSYVTLVRGIRERAPSARIVVANLPNMAGLPYASGQSLVRRQALQRISVGMSRTEINTLTAQNVVVVDLLCDGRAYDPGNYSGDGFHPNDRGYAFMAEVLIEAIDRGSSIVSSSCPQATLVPEL